MKGVLKIKVIATILCASAVVLTASSCMQAETSVDKKLGKTSPTQSVKQEQATSPEDAIAQVRRERLKGVLDKFLKEQNFSGSVLVGVENMVVYTAAKGYADTELKTRNKKDTKYEIGSVTKQFTAAAVMMFAEKGKLSASDTIDKFFPDYQHGEEVTVENLMNMTSGIPDYLNDQLYLCETGDADPKSKFTTDDVLSLINERDLEFEPGTQFAYSNTNYYLLGNIIEQLSGMKYEDFIKRKILEPFSMNSTSLKLTDATAKGYLKDGEEGLHVNSSYFGPAGEMVSTVEDIFKWQCAFFSGKVVNKATVDKILTDSGVGYGYGWFLNDDYCYHTGNTMAFYAFDLIGYSEDIKVVALSNVDDSTTSDIGQEIYKLTKAALFG